MKNKNLLTAIAYWFLAMALVLFISGCRSKKSTTDFKQTATEIVSVTDNSTVAKKTTVQENNQETKNETVIDKSFFEAWMEIKSDEATFEDKAGNKWTFKNPKVNQKSSQSNDIAKSDVVVAKSEITTTNEENQKSNINASLSKETKTGLKTTDERKTKIVWLYVIIGAVFVICFVYLIKRYSKKSN